MSDAPPTPPDDLSGLMVETRRLVLRQPTRDDAAELARLANDSRIAENVANLPNPYTLADALAFIDNTEVGPLRVNFGIYSKDDGFVGTIGLMPGEGERVTLGYWVGEAYWGRGYATEAAQAMVDLAFERLDAPFVAASARVTNSASRRVLEKTGFQWAGQGMGPSLYFRGMVPVDRFRIDQAVWRSLKSWRQSRVSASVQLEKCG
jgi:RimJ/RimL family protein N-acetyltransferase